MVQRFAASIERAPRAWVTAVTALYFAGTLAKSHQKPLWFDEIMADAISRAGGFPQILQAIRSDGQPPLPFLLIQWSHRILGYGDFATRFPSVLGMWLLCICLYLIVRRRCGPVWGLCAMTLPLATGAYWYATEARAYALVLGFTGLALWGWTNAAEGRKRPVALPALALSLAAAVCCHYYAVQISFALGVGEAVRTVVRKKLDFAIWAALAIGAAPLFVLIPIARSTSAVLFASIHTAPRFAFGPHYVDAVLWYSTVLVPAIIPLLAALAVAALIRRPGFAKVEAYPPWEIAASAGFLMLPLVIVLGTKFTTGYYMWRYALPALAGVVLSMVYGIRSAMKGSTAVAVLWLAANGSVVAVKAVRNARLAPEQPGFSAAMAGFPASDTLPIVVANPLTFLQAVRYSPPDVISRLRYLTDHTSVMEQPDFIPELTLTAARDWATFPVEEYSVFTKHFDRYWVYSTGDPTLEWLPELRATHGKNVFLLVRR